MKINENTERDILIFRDYLLPVATLKTVGESYGITRERVRQIIEKHTKSLGIENIAEIKEELYQSSTKFKCPICGKLKPESRFNNITCSKKCDVVYSKYDFTQPYTCSHCKGEYYKFRNWRYVEAENATNFCSIQCYLDSGKLRNLYREKIIGVRRKDKTCQYCGKTFKGQGVKFCGRECRDNHRNAKLRIKRSTFSTQVRNEIDHDFSKLIIDMVSGIKDREMKKEENRNASGENLFEYLSRVNEEIEE